MNKLTKEEKKEIEDIFNISIYSTEYYPHETFSDLFERKLTEWIEQKKKQWQEEASRATTIKWIVSRLSKKTLASMDRYKPSEIIFEEASEFTKEEMDFLLKRYGLDRP